MLKKEIIWRELLYQTIEKRATHPITQKSLALHFRFSLSTIFHALKVPREIGAVSITRQGVVVRDSEKFVALWGTVRRLSKDTAYTAAVSLPPLEIEKQMPDGIVWGAYSAFRLQHAHSAALPATYDKVYVYAPERLLPEIQKRFPTSSRKGEAANLLVLKADPYLTSYGKVTTIAQTLADLWNCKEWYAREFYKALRARVIP